MMLEFSVSTRINKCIKLIRTWIKLQLIEWIPISRKKVQIRTNIFAISHNQARSSPKICSIKIFTKTIAHLALTLVSIVEFQAKKHTKSPERIVWPVKDSPKRTRKPLWIRAIEVRTIEKRILLRKSISPQLIGTNQTRSNWEMKQIMILLRKKRTRRRIC